MEAQSTETAQEKMETLSKFSRDWVTMTEAAAHLQVNKSTVREWIKKGRITAVRLGYKTVRVSSSSIAQMLSHPTEKEGRRTQRYIPRQRLCDGRQLTG